ncbi:MAG: YaaL family protein [Lachnospiraceae bacterium]|nr:YaaL family protein [Lachnospiraceae bacterium]
MFFRTKKHNPTKEALEKDLERTLISLETAYTNFENVTDPDLIDCYIYEVNAAQKRYQFLLKKLAPLQKPNL